MNELEIKCNHSAHNWNLADDGAVMVCSGCGATVSVRKKIDLSAELAEIYKDSPLYVGGNTVKAICPYCLELTFMRCIGPWNRTEPLICYCGVCTAALELIPGDGFARMLDKL
jgi:predicted RNA-binding Zn-ribbon protein involved in translation (DUF1610 family)